MLKKALLILAALALPFSAAAAETGASHGPGITLLWIAIIVLAARAGSLVERLGQPAVLGEILAGVVLGNLALFGGGFLAQASADPSVMFLAELGLIILLFEVGLESNLREMLKVGSRAVLVALCGVVVPFVLGAWVAGPYLLPGLSANAYLFLGAAFTATSVGITARVFRDLGQARSREARIVLGASVIDDVLGLVILAVVSAIVAQGSVGIGGTALILGKAVAFLVGSIVLGLFLAPRLGRWFSRVHEGIAMKLSLAISAALVFAYGAGAIGLAPIIGAFAAGLVLDPSHFRHFDRPRVADELEAQAAQATNPEIREDLTLLAHAHAERHIEDLIQPISLFLVPIFFVVTGMSVDLSVFLDPGVLLAALGLSAVAVAGKYVAGAFAGPGVNRHLIGFAMVPRGEVGLIFATTGLALGVLDARTFSVVVAMVVLTTLVTPPVLTRLSRAARSAADTV